MPSNDFTDYALRGMGMKGQDMANEQVIARWQEKATDPEIAQQLAELLASGDTDAIEDAFYRNLEFGTAGLRGVLGAGTNRMNVYTVGQATQGLCDYLIDFFDVLAGGNLRHDPSIQRVQRNLRGDDVGADIAPVYHHCCRCLIAGAFNCQNPYFPVCLFSFHKRFHHSLLPYYYQKSLRRTLC